MVLTVYVSYVYKVCFFSLNSIKG